MTAIPAALQNPDSTLNESESLKRWTRVRAYGLALGGYRLLAPLGLFCEVITDARISPLPNSPAHFCGLISVRGKLVPVYQLYSLIEQKMPANPYVFVMGTQERQAALLIGAKPHSINFDGLEPKSDDAAALPEILRSCVSSGFCESGNTDQTWWQLEHQTLFANLARMH